MLQLTKIETIRREASARMSVVERLTKEKPFTERKFKTGIMPYATSNSELEMCINLANHTGLVLQTPIVNEVIRDRQEIEWRRKKRLMR